MWQTIIDGLSAVTGFMGPFTPLISAAAGALGVFISYWVSQWMKHQADIKNASDKMADAMLRHSGDGSLSVGDAKSVEDQVDKLKAKANEIDNQPKPGGASGS